MEVMYVPQGIKSRHFLLLISIKSMYILSECPSCVYI